jgi:hypothetical protein
MQKRSPDGPSADLSTLRRQITELVAQNAVPMVQQAIDAVREEGQYQAIKYLFEMIGLYPAGAQDESSGQESLARTLLQHLGLPEATSDIPTSKKEITSPHPLE